MPVHPDFFRAPSICRRAFLNHLGLSPELLTVCITAGWAGGGNMLKIYQALSKVKRPIQTIFLCGHNQSLYEKAMELAAESDVPTAVLPFHDCMPDLMSAVDMMITKAGGLTTYQAVARRLPLAFDVLTEPMPQEKGTISMLVEEKVASAIHEPEDIIAIVDSLEVVAERATHPLPTNHQLNLTDTGVFQMAKCILDMIYPPVVITPEETTAQEDISAVSIMTAAHPMSVES
jgi:UDP-N-acetylglucosamine:LPS N-acetylglucosamine transferase